MIVSEQSRRADGHKDTDVFLHKLAPAATLTFRLDRHSDSLTDRHSQLVIGGEPLDAQQEEQFDVEQNRAAFYLVLPRGLG